MKPAFLLFGLAVLSWAPCTPALAQSRPKTTAKPAAKPAAKPTGRPAVAPAAPAKPVTAPAPAAPSSPQRKSSSSTTAAGGAFDVGTNVLNLGIGVGSRYGYGAGYFGGSSSVSPALSVSFERGIIPLGPGVLGVGGFVGYQGASYDFGSGDKWKFRDIMVMARGAWHYPVSPQFDAYGGLGLGVRHLSSSFDGSSSYFGDVSSTDVVGGLFLGGRYFFSESIGAFAELGYDQSYLKVGLSAKF